MASEVKPLSREQRGEFCARLRLADDMFNQCGHDWPSPCSCEEANHVCAALALNYGARYEATVQHLEQQLANARAETERAVAAEREACADLAVAQGIGPGQRQPDTVALRIASAIRARGEGDSDV